MRKRSKISARLFFICSLSALPLLNVSIVHAQPSLSSRSVLSNKVTLLLPADFKPMSTDMLETKYPSVGHRPTEVHTNEAGSINIALNHTTNKVSPEQLPDIKKMMEGSLKTPSVEFIKSQITDINGKKFVLLEFVSTAVDTKIYNLMAISSLEGRMIAISFNCTQAHRAEWETVGKKIIGSIQLK